MARRRNNDTAAAVARSVEDSLPMQTATVPLAPDKGFARVDEYEDDDDDDEFEYEDVSEDSVEVEEEDIETRVGKARTIFHQQNGETDTVNSTRSLWDADIEYTTIHGRRYAGDYYIPNDEEEQTRQEMLHGVFLHVLDDEYTTVPLSNPLKILDVGCGTGEWVMGMAEQYPNTEVIGTDIAHIQPTSVTINCFFELDDAEGEGGWTWPNDIFDLVHFRSMAGAFTSWATMYQESFKKMKPGGYIEVLDFDNHAQVLSYFTPDSSMYAFLDALNNAMANSGRDRSSKHMNAQALSDAGFVDIKLVEKDIPMGIWPENKKEKSVAKVFLVALLCGIESNCLRPLTERGWDIDEIRRICSEVTEEIRNICMDPVRGRGMCVKMRILTGRKPGAFELDVPDGRSMTGDSIRTVTETNFGANGISS